MKTIPSSSTQPGFPGSKPFVPSKFMRGDLAYTILSDEALCFTVERVTLDWRQSCCAYCVGYYSGKSSDESGYRMFFADKCFKTKEDLLASL